MANVTPRILSGFMELLPAEQILFNELTAKIGETYEEFGFVPMDTPLVELSEVLLAKIGEDTKKEIYRFMRNDDDLSLRFDLTVPLARFVATNAQRLAFPFRRYQIGKVYRGERPQKGRFREFYQADIDIIGNGKLGLINDAEIPAVIYSIFKKLNIGDFVIRISNRKILNGLVAALGFEGKTDEVLRLVDKLDKIGDENVRVELEKVGISKDGVEKIMSFIMIDGDNQEIITQLNNLGIGNKIFEEGVEDLNKVVEMALGFGVPKRNLQIDLTIARGLSYYTGTVYETKMLNEDIAGSVCGGGRYDNLADSFTKNSYPGVGVSIGLTRLFSQLLAAKVLLPKTASVSEVLVVSMDEDIKYALKITDQLRLGGIKTEFASEGLKLVKKLEYADKLVIPFVIILGEKEQKENKVTLKNMSTGEQYFIDVIEAVGVVKESRV